MISDSQSLHLSHFAPSRTIGSVLRELACPILRGDLLPGDRLAPEGELIQRLGISRTLLRDAFKILAGKGLIETRQKTGTRVQPKGDWNLLDRDVLAWLISVQEPEAFMYGLHEFRLALEPGAAELAAERASEEDLLVLKKCCDTMDAADSDFRVFNEADLLFHSTILRASGNDFFIAVSAGIKAYLLTFFRLTSEDPEAFDAGRPLHRRLYECIAARDPAGARDAMNAVLAGAGPVIERLVLARRSSSTDGAAGSLSADQRRRSEI